MLSEVANLIDIGQIMHKNYGEKENWEISRRIQV
jgi:hypothetical protein